AHEEALILGGEPSVWRRRLRISRARCDRQVGAIDPFDFAQGRLSIASSGSGLQRRSAQEKACEPPCKNLSCHCQAKDGNLATAPSCLCLSPREPHLTGFPWGN